MLYASENLKAVICEKPVVLSLEELLKIKELIIQRQISLYVNHTRRYNRNYRMIHEIIRSGKLGELTQINGYINAGGQSFKGEGPLLHDGIHLIDIINYLHGGLPENIYVRTEKQDSIECNVNCYYNTDSDVDVYINLASDKGFFYFGLELYFEKGKIRIGNHEFSVEKTAPSSRYSGFIETEKIRPEEIIDIMKISKKDFFTTLYEEVCENLRESIFSTKDLETSQLSHYMIDLMLGADNHGKVIIPDLSFL
jgi:predicted dehydrogenase